MRGCAAGFADGGARHGPSRPLRRHALRRPRPQVEEAAVGINLVVDATDNATAIARSAAGDFDVYFLGHANSSGDPNNSLFLVVDSARQVNYRVAQQIVLADRPIIVLFHGSLYAAVSRSVAGVTLAGGTGNVQVANAQLTP